MYLVDTNVISETRRPVSGNRGALRWLDSVDPALMHLSVVTDLELERGVLSMERRDAAQGVQLRAWVESVRAEFSERLLAIGPTTARICARIQVPDRRPIADALIAATALEHGFTVVTRNVHDFDIPGLHVIDPFD